MKITRWLVPATGALILSAGWLASPGQAAPIGSAAADALREAGSQSAAVEQVHGRRCWRHRGHWHCRRHVRRWHRPYYYHGGYYPRRSYYYRSRPGFAIYGPGFGLYIAPRYKRRWY